MAKKIKLLRFPVVSEAAERLVQGHLMRRNILTYKAPPNNEGYDLSCIHPEPSKATKHIRVQVKSRSASDCERWVPLSEKSLDAFDYLVVVFLNVGNLSKNGSGMKDSHGDGHCTPEFFTFPRSFVQEHHRKSASVVLSPNVKRFEWLDVKKLESDGDIDIEKYRGDSGFELIAEALGIQQLCRPAITSRGRKPERETQKAESITHLNAEIEDYEWSREAVDRRVQRLLKR